MKFKMDFYRINSHGFQRNTKSLFKLTKIDCILHDGVIEGEESIIDRVFIALVDDSVVELLSEFVSFDALADHAFCVEVSEYVFFDKST